jgi:broad-specificity NMP kinase
MSGAGKSRALAALARRGHNVVDTDDGGWTEDVPLGRGPESERLWREDKINALISEHVASTLFISGCVANQGLFYSRFDAVVLLTAPLDVLLERVISRTTNPYGKASAERAEIITYTSTIEPLLRVGAIAQLDTTQMQPDEVADELERIAGVAT